MKNRFALLVLMVGASVLLGCDQDTKKNALPEVRIGYFPNLTHAQAVLGVSSGEFATAVAPTKIVARQFNAGPALIEALFAKQIDIGYVGPGPVISATAQSHGQGVRVISGAAANGVVIVARDGSGISSLSDLKGKKIATPQHGNTQDIAARHYLTSSLKQADTANVLPVPNADQAGMMSRGNIDAAWVPEPWGSLLISKTGAKLIGEEKDLWPDKMFSLTVIVTSPEFLAAHPEVVEKILGVNHAWTNRLNSEPQKYVPQLEEALAALTGKALRAGIAAEAIGRVKFTEEALPATFDANAQWSSDLGFSAQKANLDGLIDLGILRKVQGADLSH